MSFKVSPKTWQMYRKCWNVNTENLTVLHSIDKRTIESMSVGSLRATVTSSSYEVFIAFARCTALCCTFMIRVLNLAFIAKHDTTVVMLHLCIYM